MDGQSPEFLIDLTRASYEVPANPINIEQSFP